MRMRSIRIELKKFCGKKLGCGEEKKHFFKSGSCLPRFLIFQQLAYYAGEVFAGEAFLGICEEFGGGAVFYEFTHVEEDHIVGEAFRLTQDMRYEDDGIFVFKFEEALLDFFA